MRRFTGNPFVDAGIAGMCAAAEVVSPQQLDVDAIERAVGVLYRVILSESAFVEKPPYKRFATSTMAMIFPNSPLPQGSYPKPEQKRIKYREFVDNALQAVRNGVNKPDERCFVCGEPAAFLVGIDRFPLMGSRSLLNFHPLLQDGEQLCAFCALSVQFLPFSLMQSKAEGGRLWFLHSLDESLVVTVAKDYGLSHLMALVAAGEPLRFAGNWACPGENGAIVSLLNELGKKHAIVLEKAAYPVSAFVFSNDNRDQFLRRVAISHRLLSFFNVLHVYADAGERFENELLRTRKGADLAAAMLDGLPLIRSCTDDSEERLLGGWVFHRLYAMEVLNMSEWYVRTIEKVAERLVADESRDKRIRALQLAKKEQAFGVLLDLVRDGVMDRREFHLFAPPNESRAAAQALDYLLGAIYALKAGEVLGQLKKEPESEPSAHPFIVRIEQVGTALVQRTELAKRLSVELAQARNQHEIRRSFLRLIEPGYLSWTDFVFFCPPDDYAQHFQSRDYWLAYLYDHLRQRGLQNEPIQDIQEEG